MSYVLKLKGVIVGRSDLEDRDPATRIATGVFRRGVGYELVEPIFALRDENGRSDRYRRARDTLALVLFDEAGTLIDTSAIDIEGDANPNELRLRAAIPDPSFWR
jgi:hypothetical protein